VDKPQPFDELVHELRDLLATISLWEQVLRATDDPEIRQQALDAIRDTARAAGALIAQIAK
jgi:hypothetical protein